ncbi:UDP-N-acetylmuramate dehydrogenase [Algicola sagamiensis]|uniref:UDP-N-acetylmuramate dehydrogenase n=1 Tax=Algicola sagamiensis TaxID=163869 RepID=UPI00037B43C5|nr:UDP-N-acetylmuramate dehydrogenase [Algicola sagamiensis]
MKSISAKPLHTFRLDQSIQNYLCIQTPHDCTQLVHFNQPLWILGEGSNTVFLRDFAGTVAHIQIQGIAIREETDHWLIEVGAGENWHALVLYLHEQGIYGLENLALIPGSVGAAPVQNIGAYGVELASFLDNLTYFDIKANQFMTLSNDACEFGYRDSVFKHKLKNRAVITQVTLTVPKAYQPCIAYAGLRELGEAATAAEVMKTVIAIRQSKLPDPTQLPNAGSFFKNPVISTTKAIELKGQYAELPVYSVFDPELKKVAAGWLIDQCGLKGKCFGGICVHQKQALVLVNEGTGTAEDLIQAITTVRHKVHERFGIWLEPEVRLLDAQGEYKVDVG